MIPTLIGFTGERNVGKSTAIKYLVGKHGFATQHTFAVGKEMTRALYKFIGIDDETAESMINGPLKDKASPFLPSGASSRFFQEELGKFMGDKLGPAWTLGIVLNNLERLHDKVVMDSIVYEADYFRSWGGIIIGIDREDRNKGITAHNTSKAIKNIIPEFKVYNNGSKEELYQKLDVMVTEIIPLYLKKNPRNLFQGYDYAPQIAEITNEENDRILAKLMNDPRIFK